MLKIVNALVVCDGNTLVKGKTLPSVVRLVKSLFCLLCFRNWWYPKPSTTKSTTLFMFLGSIWVSSGELAFLLLALNVCSMVFGMFMMPFLLYCG